MDEEIGRVELSKKLSDLCRNTGRVSFKITYTNTDGNSLVDKEFQDFCYKYANNEYLAGIGLLLKSFRYYEQLEAVNEHLKLIDNRLSIIEESLSGDEEVSENKEIKEKTF